MEYAELVLRIEKTAQLYCEKVADDPSLWNHTSLVREFAMRLAAVENANPKVVEIASLLHDVGKSVDKENHHVTSAQLAKEVLKENGLTEQEKKLIIKCILKHRRRFHSEENEIEVKVVQSADILGALFNDWWQEHCRNTHSREELTNMYQNILGDLNLESARSLARPRVEVLMRIAEDHKG